MNILLTGAPFLASVLLAAVMGFAIQRGATCMVAAVDEVVARRRFARLAAMLAASLWVLAGLLVAQSAHWLPRAPAGYEVSGWTIAGGALLGLGAFVGRACVFGAIARFGNGEWSYLMVPVGFYAGCASVAPLFMPMMPTKLARSSTAFDNPGVAAALIALVVAMAFVRARRTARERAAASSYAPAPLHRVFAARAWSPAVATAMIGITFFLMMLLVGPWAYTEALADIARGMSHDLPARALLMIALFAGAFTGGLTAHRFGSTPATLPRLLRCFASGALMGWGSLLIPGGNDGLILVGMPLLYPYAWLAMISMALTIGVAMIATRTAASARPIAPAS